MGIGLNFKDRFIPIFGLCPIKCVVYKLIIFVIG